MRKKFIIFNLILVILQVPYFYLYFKAYIFYKEYITDFYEKYSNNFDISNFNIFQFFMNLSYMNMYGEKLIKLYIFISLLALISVIICILQFKRCIYCFKNNPTNSDKIKLILLIVLLYIPCFIVNIRFLFIVIKTLFFAIQLILKVTNNY